MRIGLARPRPDRSRSVLTHLSFTVYLFAAAFLFALLEVQIEGPAGWAQKLPTWRIQNRITRILLGNRAITGYHVFFHVFVIALAHAPFALGLARISVAAELRIAAFIILFWVVEDFLWFLVNPAYGLRAFRRERIRWHARSWWGVMPRDYWIFAPLGLALYLLSWRV
jgi:hypothetical protein